MSSKNLLKKLRSLIPARVIFLLLSFFGFNLVYIHTVVFSVALVAMVGKSGNQSDGSNKDYGNECLITSYNNTSNSNVNISKMIAQNIDTGSDSDYNWDSNKQALLLGAFFYGYVLTQIPGALLAQHFGSKWLFGFCILLASLMSLLGPFCAQLSFEAFFMTRFVEGLALGVAFPSVNLMLARWLPDVERSSGISLIFTGSRVSLAVALPIAGLLCCYTFFGGWPAIFYILGIVGCVWFLFWTLLVYESPDNHPYITMREIEYIRKGQMDVLNNDRPIIPWKSILTSIPVYALIITHFGQNWGFLTILTMLPTYFQKILHLDIKNNGLLSSLPYLLQAFCGWIAGLISDKIRKSGKFSVNTIRKFNNSIAFIGPAICLIGVTMSQCSTTLSVVFFTLAMGLNGPSFSGFGCTHVDMAPDFAAILMGITNTIANLPGFLAPVVANALTKNEQTLANWSYVFYLCSLIFVITAIVYVIFASAQLQPWGISDPINRHKLSITNNSTHSTHSTQQIKSGPKVNSISTNLNS